MKIFAALLVYPSVFHAKFHPPWGLAGENNRYYHISGTTK